MELKFTPHPLVEAPTDEEIVILGESDPQALQELHRVREGLIRASQEDPLRHGFDLEGWGRIRKALNAYNEVLALGGNRSGKTTGCAKLVMEAVKKIGYDIEGYCALFDDIEEEIDMDVFERIGDSRYFARENENNLDLFASFSEFGYDFVPSDGRREVVGIFVSYV